MLNFFIKCFYHEKSNFCKLFFQVFLPFPLNLKKPNCKIT